MIAGLIKHTARARNALNATTHRNPSSADERSPEASSLSDHLRTLRDQSRRPPRKATGSLHGLQASKLRSDGETASRGSAGDRSIGRRARAHAVQVFPPPFSVENAALAALAARTRREGTRADNAEESTCYGAP